MLSAEAEKSVENVLNALLYLRAYSRPRACSVNIGRSLRMASSVEDKVKQIIVEQLGVDESEVTPTASFIDDLGADSLDTVELVMALEEGFGMEIPDEDAEKITTVKDAINYIESHL